jgi:uncharacterized membrane protein YgdD (TMEM256/DUF423 family)
MSPRACIAIGALLAGTAVAFGAFGAHALHERLEAAGELDTWETAARYQLAHGIALVLVGILRERRGGLALAAWSFALGSLAFSGSLYGLSLGILRAALGPITPLGGALLIVGWLALALAALRRSTAPRA